jgi:hypothetical protein
VEGAAVLVEHGDGAALLFDALRARGGVELHAAGFLCAFQQRQVHVHAVDHCIRVAEALAKGLAGGDATDLGLVDRVVHHHAVGVHRAATRLFAHAQRVEGRKRVRTELDAGTDLADLG